VIVAKPLATCGCRKFQLDPLGDHLETCTVHSGAKKAHDWTVDQLPDLFRTTHKVKTQQVIKSRGQPCGDIELAGYLPCTTDIVITMTSNLIHLESNGNTVKPPVCIHGEVVQGFGRSKTSGIPTGSLSVSLSHALSPVTIHPPPCLCRFLLRFLSVSRSVPLPRCLSSSIFQSPT
jgi:hypothetical protein